MKQENSSERDDAVRKLLREWKIEESLPPRFGERVWQRIAREEAQASANLWIMLANRVGRALRRPSLAAGYVTLLLALGVMAGYWQARNERAHALHALSSRYVQMIDPYQPPRH